MGMASLAIFVDNRAETPGEESHPEILPTIPR